MISVSERYYVTSRPDILDLFVSVTVLVLVLVLILVSSVQCFPRVCGRSLVRSFICWLSWRVLNLDQGLGS